jgi:ABC-2 type transport system permease protein
MMVRWEIFKLLRQRRTYLGLGAAALVPLLILAAVEILGSGPEAGEAPFAAQLFNNGLVIPLIALALGSVVLLPLLTVLVAGDTIAGEVSGGTLKTILGRSVGRSGLFWSKAAAVTLYTLAVLVVFIGVGLVAGWLAIGFRPLAGLGGAPIPVGEVLTLIWFGAGLVSLPLLALAAFSMLLSAVTHNSIASVGGAVVLILILQLISSLGLGGALDPYLLTNQFTAWLNLMRDPIDWAPIVRSAWVSVVWAAISLAAAWFVFVRRDVLS